MKEQHISFTGKQARKFADLIETMDKRFSNAKIVFKEDEAVLYASDPAMIALTRLKLNPEGEMVDTYHGTGEEATFNVTSLKRLLKPSKQDLEKVEITYIDKVQKNEKLLQLNTQTEFGRLAAPITQENIEIEGLSNFGKLDHCNKVETSFQDFSKAVTAVETTSDGFYLNVDEKGIEIETYNEAVVRVAAETDIKEESVTQLDINYVSSVASKILRENDSGYRIKILQANYDEDWGEAGGDYPVKIVVEDENLNGDQNFEFTTVIAPRVEEG